MPSVQVKYTIQLSHILFSSSSLPFRVLCPYLFTDVAFSSTRHPTCKKCPYPQLSNHGVSPLKRYLERSTSQPTHHKRSNSDFGFKTKENAKGKAKASSGSRRIWRSL